MPITVTIGYQLNNFGRPIHFQRETSMETVRSKGWRLILEMAAGGAVVCGFFILILYNTTIGEIFPDVLKLWGPIACWFITLVFLVMHMTPDGDVDFKIR